MFAGGKLKDIFAGANNACIGETEKREGISMNAIFEGQTENGIRTLWANRSAKISAIGALIRAGAATRTVNRRVVPSAALAALLPGTKYADPLPLTGADISRGRIEELIREANDPGDDGELRRLSCDQGIDIDEWVEALEIEDRQDV